MKAREVPTVADLALRNATDEDRDFLRAMLYEAAFWRPAHGPRPPFDEALEAPELAVYVEGWGREGDRGIIATSGGERLGAAWYRLFSEDRHGYGFIDPHTPELTIAVTQRRRALGVGRALLAALMVQARLDRLQALSLSVETDNPAAALYEGFGFTPVERVGNAHTMIASLAPHQPAGPSPRPQR